MEPARRKTVRDLNRTISFQMLGCSLQREFPPPPLHTRRVQSVTHFVYRALMWAYTFLVQLLGMWGSTDFLFLEKLDWISYHYLFQTRKYIEESYINSRQCLIIPECRYPTPNRVYSLAFCNYLQSLFATANKQHHKICLFSMVQKNVLFLLDRS